MSLEIQNQMGFGFGLRVQRWPKTRHVILHLGRVESRLILQDGRSMLAIAFLLVGGWLAGTTK